MAVYTTVSSDDFRQLTGNLGLTPVSEPVGAADGIENTTYFFTASDSARITRDYVLTILENVPASQARYSAALTRHLCNTGLPVPCPRFDSNGAALQTLAEKPALVFPRVNGEHPDTVTRSHCADIGSFLARSHLASQSFEPFNTNHRGALWLDNARQALESCLSAADYALVRDQSERFQRINNREPDLPTGPIHGDLFRDNALFMEDTLVGVIDYYNACNDWWLLDVAIAVNDWCSAPEDSAELDPRLCDELLDSYHSIRPFTTVERQYWQDILCFACTRFWVSRLLSKHLPTEREKATPGKDPGEYRRKLVELMVEYPPLPRQ